MRTTKDFVFFYGAEDIYSNFHYAPFYHQGILFKWSEQAVMYRKAMLFGAKHIARQILEAETPSKCKQLGRSREIPFNEKEWEIHRKILYTEVLLDKFSVPHLKESIINTGSKQFVEASPRDTIWGVGLAATDPRIIYPSNWRGLNLLGDVLMNVRDLLNSGVEKVGF